MKSSSGLSTGASIGIGIAAGLVICLLAAMLLSLMRRRQRTKVGRPPPDELMPSEDRKGEVVWHEMDVPPSELANQAYELGGSGSTMIGQRGIGENVT